MKKQGPCKAGSRVAGSRFAGRPVSTCIQAPIRVSKHELMVTTMTTTSNLLIATLRATVTPTITISA